MSSLEIFENIDLNSQSWIQNPPTLYAKLHKRGPYFDGTKWLVARHAHVAAVLKSQAISKRIAVNTLGGTLENFLIFQDPPDHTRLRSVILRSDTFFLDRCISRTLQDVPERIDLLCSITDKYHAKKKKIQLHRPRRVRL